MKVGMCHVCYAQDVKVMPTEVKSRIQTATEVKDSIMQAMQGEDSSQMKIGICDICHASEVEIADDR